MDYQHHKRRIAGWGIAGFILLHFTVVPCLLAHGPDHEAVEKLNQQILAAPNDTGLYLKRGTLLRRSGHVDDALDNYQRVLALDPGADEALLGLAWCHLDQTNMPAASVAIRRYLDRRPDHPTALYLAGLIDARQGLPGKAVEEFRRAIAVNANAGPDLHLALAEALLACSPPRTNEAMQFLEDSLTRWSRVPALEKRLIQLKMAALQTDEALRWLDPRIADSQEPGELLNLRGDRLLQAGRRAEALSSFQAARRAFADSASSPVLKEIEQKIHALQDEKDGLE